MLNTAGFAPHASGLLVPEEFKREREVWTKDETKAVMKALTLLEKRGLAVLIGCPEDTCRKAPIERVRNLDGSITMRCEHKDRLLSRAF